MPYIPKEHEKFDVIPYCREHGGEVFEYPWMFDIEKMEEGLTIPMPYGYLHYDDYIKKLDEFINLYKAKQAIYNALIQWKKDFEEINVKEYWSICKYIGEDTDADEFTGLTHGKTYYWPTSKNKPIYHGVIDDEEFTAYQYSTNPDEWEILLDSTGMAYRTIFGKTMYFGV